MNAVGKPGEAHHIIPFEMRKKPGVIQIVKKAARGGFEMNRQGNGILLDSSIHKGSHPKYNLRVEKKLKTIAANQILPNGTAKTDAQIAGEVATLISQLRAGLKKRVTKLT